jgi:hypothetical protein
MNKTRRRITTAICAVAALGFAVGITGCGDDNSADATPTPRPEPSAAPSTNDPESTTTANPAPTSGAAPEEIEVRGVVGVVNEAASTIEIRATAGGDYSNIIIDASTDIRRAGGGSARLSDIRSSDRIVVVGTAGDEAGTLLASEIAIQQLSPGGPQPGG